MLGYCVLQMAVHKGNVYTSTQSASRVNSYVSTIDLKNTSGGEFKTENFWKSVKLVVPREVKKMENNEGVNFMKPKDDYYIRYLSTKVNVSLGSIGLKVNPLDNQTCDFTVVVKFEQRPTLEDYDYIFHLPNYTYCQLNNSQSNATKEGCFVSESEIKKLQCSIQPDIVFISSDMMETHEIVYFGK